VERLPVGRLRWEEQRWDLDSAPMAHWAARLRDWPGARQTLLRIRLQGAASAEIAAGLAQLQRLLEERFLYGELDAAGLRPAEAAAELQQLLGARHLRRAAEELQRRAGGDGEQGAVARRALQMLQQLAWEGRGPR
jgi:hypothetical protein